MSDWEKLNKKEQNRVKKYCKEIGMEIEPFKKLTESIDWDKGISIQEFSEKYNEIFKKEE